MKDRNACPLCGSRDLAQSYCARDYNRAVCSTLFVYLKCESCGTLFLHNVPEDLGPYYSESYFKLPDHVATGAPPSKVNSCKLELLTAYSQPCRLLELGPGDGSFAYLAKSLGYKPEVIEQDKRCRDHIREVLQIPAFEGPEDLSALAAGSFECVALWHVFEHLRDPLAFLEGLTRILTPGGAAILAVPNPESFQFQVFGRFWAHLDAPRHVTLPPAEAVIAAAASRGLHKHALSYSDRATQYWNRFGWIESAKNVSKTPGVAWALQSLGYGMATASYILRSIDPSRSAYTLVLRKSAS